MQGSYSCGGVLRDGLGYGPCGEEARYDRNDNDQWTHKQRQTLRKEVIGRQVGRVAPGACHEFRVSQSVPTCTRMELFYNQYGDDGSPLIILHGLLGAHGNWHTLSRTTFSDVARVYAVDQRNHGRSPHADRMDYDVMAADVREFIDREGLEGATLLGHSMGGKTAMQTALSYPDVVDRLIVVDMAPKKYPARHDHLLKALDRIDPTTYGDRDAIDAALAEDVPSRPIRQFLLKNLDYDGERYAWRMNLDAIRAHYDNLNAALPTDATFEGPSLFIRGGESDYVDEEDLPDIRTRFPAARLVTIDGAGHWIHADSPEPFAEAVLQFLREEHVA